MSVIRPIQIHNDLTDVLLVEKQCFGQGFSGAVFFYLYELSPSHFMVSHELTGNLSGYCIGAVSKTTDSRGWIVSMAVAKQFQRQGLGSRLLEEVVSSFPDTVEEVALTVKIDNTAAVKCYLQNGFRVADTPPDLYGDRIPRYLMSRRRKV